ncbi:hypothetical protein Dimus_015622 [Dionaea muscipula]
MYSTSKKSKLWTRCSSCEAAAGEKGCLSSKDPESSSSDSSRKHQASEGEQRVDFGLPTAIDLGAGKEVAAKAQNGGERKCEAATTNVIIISTETSNGRAVKERSRKKKTGGPTFTSLLTARSKLSLENNSYTKSLASRSDGIGGVVGKREDLIIVDIDEAYGDDELVIL